MSSFNSIQVSVAVRHKVVYLLLEPLLGLKNIVYLPVHGVDAYMKNSAKIGGYVGQRDASLKFMAP